MRIDTKTAAKAFVDTFNQGEETENKKIQYPAEQDHEKIFNHLRFAEKLFPKNGIGLCPVSHANVGYYSLNCEQVLGHPHAELLKWSLPEFFSFVHPDDLPSLQQCFQYIGNYNAGDPETHRFVVQFRFRSKHNNYEHIRNEQLAIKVGDNSYLFLMLYSNISQEEKFYQVKLDIFRRINGNYLKTYTYNPQQQEKAITPRQNEIARLVSKGYSNQQIADQLGVSIYTVKNHKQMIFRRVNVRNSIELVNYVKEISG